MKSLDLTKLRKAIGAAAQIAPIEEIKMQMNSSKFEGMENATAIAYRLSVDIENVTFILVDSGDNEYARYTNGAVLNLPPMVNTPQASKE